MQTPKVISGVESELSSSTPTFNTFHLFCAQDNRHAGMVLGHLVEGTGNSRHSRKKSGCDFQVRTYIPI